MEEKPWRTVSFVNGLFHGNVDSALFLGLPVVTTAMQMLARYPEEIGLRGEHGDRLKNRFDNISHLVGSGLMYLINAEIITHNLQEIAIKYETIRYVIG